MMIMMILVFFISLQKKTLISIRKFFDPLNTWSFWSKIFILWILSHHHWIRPVPKYMFQKVFSVKQGENFLFPIKSVSFHFHSFIRLDSIWIWWIHIQYTHLFITFLFQNEKLKWKFFFVSGTYHSEIVVCFPDETDWTRKNFSKKEESDSINIFFSMETIFLHSIDYLYSGNLNYFWSDKNFV